MNTLKGEIVTAMARAFFACAWADQCEECGHSSILSGQGIMDLMPDEIDPAAIHAADTLARDMIASAWPGKAVEIEQGLRVLLQRAEQLRQPGEGDRELTPELFGHYCAMQAMGSGVGLWDSFGDSVYQGIKVPYCEFGSHSLEKDYFQPTDDSGE